MTTTDLKVGGLVPDPEGVAARVVAESEGGEATPPPARRGRPPKSSRDRVRKHRLLKRTATTAKAEPEEPEPIEVTEADIQSAIPLARTVWDLVGPMFRLKPLDDDQAARLGVALAPLVKKYLPLLADWQHEVNFAIVVFALARENAVPKVKPKEVEAPEATASMRRTL